uniref:Putative secreted protein n=1 Tax=Anopheles darlingi TaxID=43151 RepID=A0A2M4D184_ANODA
MVCFFLLFSAPSWNTHTVLCREWNAGETPRSSRYIAIRWASGTKNPRTKELRIVREPRGGSGGGAWC